MVASMKINFDLKLALSLAGGVLLSVGLIGLAALVANRLFGFFSYPALSPGQVDAVAKEYDRRFRIVTRACDATHCRGIYDMGGSLYYYSWHFGKSYEIYPVVYERYTTESILLGDKPSLTYP